MFSIEKQSIAFNKLLTNWEKISFLVSAECQLLEGTWSGLDEWVTDTPQ